MTDNHLQQLIDEIGDCFYDGVPASKETEQRVKAAITATIEAEVAAGRIDELVVLANLVNSDISRQAVYDKIIVGIEALQATQQQEEK